MWKTIARGLGASALLTVAPFEPAVAGEFTEFRAGVAPAGCPAPLGSSPASGSWTETTNGSASSSAFGSAAGGVLTGDASSSAVGVSVFAIQIGSCFHAEAVIDDIIITGPGPSASVQVTADLFGTVEASAGAVALASASVYATISICTVVGSGVVCSPPAVHSSSFGNPAQATVDLSLTTQSSTKATNTPFAVKLVLRARTVSRDDQQPGTSSASVNFSNGLRFPTSGPVFLLPPGYTANSLDGHIVDNQFVGVPSVPALSIPAIALLALALASLTLCVIARRAPVD